MFTGDTAWRVRSAAHLRSPALLSPAQTGVCGKLRPAKPVFEFVRRLRRTKAATVCLGAIAERWNATRRGSHTALSTSISMRNWQTGVAHFHGAYIPTSLANTDRHGTGCVDGRKGAPPGCVPLHASHAFSRLRAAREPFYVPDARRDPGVAAC